LCDDGVLGTGSVNLMVSGFWCKIKQSEHGRMKQCQEDILGSEFEPSMEEMELRSLIEIGIECECFKLFSLSPSLLRSFSLDPSCPRAISLPLCASLSLLTRSSSFMIWVYPVRCFSISFHSWVFCDDRTFRSFTACSRAAS
jgi:hypothetical protein